MPSKWRRSSPAGEIAVVSTTEGALIVAEPESKAAYKEPTAPVLLGSGTTARAASSKEAVNAGAAIPATSGGCAAPLVIDADAPLAEGVRALILHHLQRVASTGAPELSEGQTELLEYHVARLAAYANKVVQTLSFATRFFAGPSDTEAAADADSAGGGATCHGGPILPHDGRGGVAAAGVAATMAAGEPIDAVAHAGAAEPRRPRKPLKLSDAEILSLYRTAQMEAAIEADWRGIQGPSPRKRGGDAWD